MKPVHGLRRRLRRRREERRKAARERAGPPERRGSENPPDEEAMAFDAAELEEFLAADESPVPVDRAFKERLRARLWRMLQEQSGDAPTAAESPPPSRSDGGSAGVAPRNRDE